MVACTSLEREIAAISLPTLEHGCMKRMTYFARILLDHLENSKECRGHDEGEHSSRECQDQQGNQENEELEEDTSAKSNPRKMQQVWRSSLLAFWCSKTFGGQGLQKPLDCKVELTTEGQAFASLNEWFDEL